MAGARLPEGTPESLSIADYAERCGITKRAALRIAAAHPEYTRQTDGGEPRISSALLFAYRDGAGNVVELDETACAAACAGTRSRTDRRR